MTLYNFALLMYALSIIFLVGAVLVSALTVLPLVAKQSTRSDQFALLRKWFLQKNQTIIGIGVIAIVALTTRFFLPAEPARVLISLLVLLFSVGYLRFALINRRIWHQDYKKIL